MPGFAARAYKATLAAERLAVQRRAGEPPPTFDLTDDVRTARCPTRPLQPLVRPCPLCSGMLGKPTLRVQTRPCRQLPRTTKASHL